MSDETTPQAGSNTQPQAGQTPASGTPEAPATPQPDGSQMVDLNAVDAQGNRLYFDQSAMKKVRDEAAEWRTKFQTLKAQLDAAVSPQTQTPTATPQQATDPAAIQRDLEQAQSTAQRALIENAVIMEVVKQAAALGKFVVDPADALRLADLSKIKIDNGTPTGVPELVKALLESKPYLLAGKSQPTLHPTNPAGTAPAESAIVTELKRRRTGGAGGVFGGGGVRIIDEGE